MSTTGRVTALGRRTHARRAHAASHHPGRAVAWLTARLVRRGTLALALGLGAYMVLETFAFDATYPDAASRESLLTWGRDPGIRIIAGPPSAIATVGGFAVWDAGIYLMLVLGVWPLTTTTRVLRGDEDAGRTDLPLAGPLRPAHALVVQLAVLLGACVVAGAAVGLGLGLSGAAAVGSIAFGAAMAGYAGSLVGVAAVMSQVLPTRGRALTASAAVLAATIFLRMVSNSADSRRWLGWWSPYGWVDRLEPYDDARWPVLLVPLAVTTVLVVTAALLRARRDAGAGLVGGREAHRSVRWGLGRASGFAWRTSLGLVVGWSIGVAVAGLLVGFLLPTMDQNIADDEGFRDVLAAMGMDAGDLADAFVGLWATILGLVMAVHAAFRMGVARAEESSGRAELLLARPLSRQAWLGGHVAGLVVSLLVLCTTAAGTLWLGGVATTAPVDAGDAFAAMLNTLPAVAVFAGLAVLLLGLAPRGAVVGTATAAGAAYVLQLVGPALDWPGWLVGLSPFHHLATVPVDPVAWGPAVAMTCVALGLAGAGFVAFRRRDVVGA
ncbi:MAG: ABC transporter permease [Terrabacter sp.]